MADKKTIIRVSEGVWKRLNAQKEIGESFDRLLIRLLGLENVEATEDAKAPGITSTGGDLLNGG